MPNLGLDRDYKLYYEVHGKGEPLILLHGIMMSTASWPAFIPHLSARFQTILVDFRDQGRSSRMREQYTLQLHVGDILKLLDHLRIPKAHVMGLSYGGQVALHFVLKHQARIKSLCLFNTPSRSTRRLREIGKAWETAAELGDGARFFRLAIPFIYSEPFYETHFKEMMDRRKAFESLLDKEWFEGLIRLARSAENYSIAPKELKTIKVPVLVVAADQDSVVSRDALKDIHENIPGCEFLVIPNAGHAAFLEKMNEFLTLLTGFVGKHS